MLNRKSIRPHAINAFFYRCLGMGTFGAGLFMGLIPAVQAITEGASPAAAAVWGAAGLSFVAMGIYWAGAHAKSAHRARHS